MKIPYASLLLLAGCDTPPAEHAFAGDAQPGTNDAEATFTAVYEQVFAGSSCLLGLCHGEGASGGGLDLDPRETAYAALVGVPGTTGACKALGLARVQPGAPDRSLLLLKLGETPPCGAMMPPDAPLDEARVRLVRAWIQRGAPND